MGTCHSKKKSLPDSEQQNKYAVNLPYMPPQGQEPPKDFGLLVSKMKTGRNGIDVFQQFKYEESDIKTVKQAIQCS